MEAERQRGGGTKTTNDKVGGEGRRAGVIDPNDLDEEEVEEEEEDDDEEDEDEERRHHSYTVEMAAMARPADLLQNGMEVGYHAHSSFSDDEMDSVEVPDRKIGAGL